jgi:nucleoside-diphosphate-sugar epimerase
MVSILDVAKAAVAASGDHTVEIVDQQQNIEYSPTAIMADIGKVKSTIDWHPRTNLTEGMARMWDAMKAEK